MIILGDALEVAQRLDSSSVDLIYIDPPFNTGITRRLDDGWYRYADSFGTPTEFMRWLSPILCESHRLLAKTGSFYLHLGKESVHYAKVELDRIFGYKNFLNEVVWAYGLGARQTKNRFGNRHDTILFYRKSEENTFHVLRSDEITPAMQAKYCHEDEQGRYMYSYGVKYYLKGGKRYDDVWDIPSIAPTAYERTGYPTQKPEALLERIILSSSSPGDLVLDLFGGSGTTAAVAHKLGRRWITSDRNPDAVSVIERRIAALPSCNISVMFPA